VTVAGHEFWYRVVADNNEGDAVTSAAAFVDVVPDTTAPTVSAEAPADLQTIVLTYSEGMNSTAGQQARYTFSPPLTISTFTFSNDNRTVIITTPQRTFGQNYTLTISGVQDDAAVPNSLTTNIVIKSDTLCFVRFDATWTYLVDDIGLDGQPWTTDLYDETGWQTGPGVFGREDAGGTTALNALIAPYTLQTLWATNINRITYYARKDITIPTIPVGAQVIMRHVIDDGAIVYTNGAEAFRYGFTNPSPAILYTNLSPRGGEAVLATNVFTNITAGAYQLAVEVHQNTTNSSDIVFGAEICFHKPTIRPTLTIVDSGANVVVSWNPVIGTLQESTDLITWTASGNQSSGVARPKPGVARFYRIEQ
jgi:hypothetical protein